MKTKLFLLCGLLVFGILLTACGPSTINVQPQPPVRTITVTGTGLVTLTPDIAYVSIGVHSQDASAKDAQARPGILKPMRPGRFYLRLDRPQVWLGLYPYIRMEQHPSPPPGPSLGLFYR